MDIASLTLNQALLGKLECAYMYLIMQVYSMYSVRVCCIVMCLLLQVATCSDASEVFVTDGNELSVSSKWLEFIVIFLMQY